MKKTLQLLPLALLIVLAACSEEKDSAELKGQVPDENYELSGLITPLSGMNYGRYFVGQWLQYSTSTVTNTVVKTADGTFCDNIHGGNTYENRILWTFESNGNGTLEKATDESSQAPGYPGPYSWPNENVFKNDFLWMALNDSILNILLFYKDDVAEIKGKKYESRLFIYTWLHDETTNSDEKKENNPYGYDGLSLSYHYTETGYNGTLASYYPGYSSSGNENYDLEKSYAEIDCTVTHYLQRN